MFFTGSTRTRHVRHQAALTTALLFAAAACSDGGSATEDVLLSTRASNSLQIVSRDSSIAVGDTATIRITTMPRTATGNGSTSSVRFNSSDGAIATVDSRGLVTGMGAGTALITARTLGGITAVIEFGISAPNGPGAPTPPAPAPPQEPGSPLSFVVPTLPQSGVNVDPPPAATRTIRVAAGDANALQSALNAAVGGDEIVLADGAVYTGAFRLPRRNGGGTVVLRSATIPVAARTRITPSQAGTLATLRATSVYPALEVDDGATGWRVIGVRMLLADNAVDNYGIVTIGSGSQTSVDQFPRDIVLDRVVVQGSSTGNTSRCVSMNGNSLAVVDSWLMECHARGRDAQAVGGWTGQGPLLIENNHLEGSGQGIMFGGSDPRVSGVTPSDITIRRNHIFKPLNWAGRWTVKAAFEIKHAQRLLFEANVIENHWADAQTGFAVLMQAGTQDNIAPWSKVRDVTFRRNIIRNSRSGINIKSRYITPGFPVIDPTRRVSVQENMFENVGRDPISGAAGRHLQFLGDIEDASIVQNTFFGTGTSNAILFDESPTVRLVVRNNVFAQASYGIIGSGYGEGAATLSFYAPMSTVTGNLLTGVPQRLYPAGNLHVGTLSFSEFVNPGASDYTLRPELAFSRADGTHVGVNGAALLSATSGVVIR